MAEDLNEDDVAINSREATTELAAKQRVADDWRLEADRLGPLFSRHDGGLGDRLVSGGLGDRLVRGGLGDRLVCGGLGEG